MSDTTTESNSETDTARTETAPDQAGDGGGSTEDAPRPNREARYRVERNEAREALTAAQSRIEQLQTREVERLAGESLSQPADLLSLGDGSLADFLTPEGWVDHEAVADAVADLLDARPGLARNPKVRATDSSQGAGNGPAGKPQWADLFKS